MTANIRGLVLFGPPASGKDTVTQVLSRVHPRFRLFEKLKLGTGRSAGYRMATEEDLRAIQSSGGLLSEVKRYGNSYFIDQKELDRLEHEGFIPVVHTADLAEASLISRRRGWVSCCLWVSRREARCRLMERGDVQVEERLALRSQMLRMLTSTMPRFDALLITDQLRPEETARRLLSVSQGNADLRPVIEDPELIVPVPTLRDGEGLVDWKANIAYASAVGHTSTCVLVAGTTGEGLSLTDVEHERLAAIWTEACGQPRVVLGHLTGRPKSVSGDDPRPLVVPDLPGWRGLEQLADTLPQAVAYSRRDLGWTIPDGIGTGIHTPFGVKVSGEHALETGAALSPSSQGLRLWHGATATAAEAFSLYADGVVLSSLAAAATRELPESWPETFRLALRERAAVRSREGINRGAALGQMVRNSMQGCA